MPKPLPGESESEFVSRCIRYVMKEGAKSTEHAAAKCHGIWRQERKKKHARRSRN